MPSPDYGTTPRFGIRYIDPATSDTLISDIDQASKDMALDVEAALLPPVVTSLPGSPYDGQRIYFLADAANGIVWHLRYRASSPNPQKWESLGGSALYAAQTAASSQITANVATSTPMTGSPSLTIPLAGAYDLLMDGDIYYNGPGSAQVDGRVQIVGSIEGTLGTPGWLLGYSEPGGMPPPANAPLANTQSGVTRQLLNAGTVLSLKVATNNTTISFGTVDGWTITARPVRVG